MNNKTIMNRKQNTGSSRSSFLGIFLIILLVFAFGFYYRSNIDNLRQSLINRVQPCGQPITYSIVNIDPRFGITQEKLLDDITKAEKIWELPINKELFEYSPTGKLKISLIYDYRQEATDALKKLGIIVRDNKATYDTLKAKYNSLNAQFNKEKIYLETLTKNYKTNQNAYEKDVNYWNSQGGAPKKEYNSLEQRRMALNNQVTTINQTQNSLNALVDTINAMVVVLNKLVYSLNLQVSKYNGIGGSIGKEFNEGEYISDVNGTAIDIFQFNDEDQLIRVLAHELGHALGVGHLDNPEAIMYRLNESANSELTADDIAALKKQCGIK